MFVIHFVVLFVAASCQQAPPGILEDVLNIFYNGIVAFRNCSDTEVLLANIDYTLYTQEDQQNGIVLNSLNLNAVNPQHRVVFIIHGWLQSGSESGTVQMKDTYLSQMAINVIIVNWSYYSNALYSTSFCSVPQVGIFTGDLIYDLTETLHIDLSNIQINGFSLGGQIAGYAGQRIQNRTGGAKIGRINGLDAAGPGFLGLPVDQRLDADDAVFVQGIHTSNWQYGYTPAYATVDFQVNFALIPGCGAIQAGCPLNPGVPSGDTLSLSQLLPYVFCNHVRAATYFIESITSNNFIATHCDSCKRWGMNICNSQNTAIMGENCPSTATGVYYLNINAKAPFAKGEARR